LIDEILYENEGLNKPIIIVPFSFYSGNISL